MINYVIVDLAHAADPKIDIVDGDTPKDAVISLGRAGNYLVLTGTTIDAVLQATPGQVAGAAAVLAATPTLLDTEAEAAIANSPQAEAAIVNPPTEPPAPGDGGAGLPEMRPTEPAA